jgi:ABC-type glycerol-3-phosphate transport system substrate-binding protein
VTARQALARWLLLAALLTLLAACAASNSPSSPAPTSPAEQRPPAVTLVLWHGWSGAQRQALSRLVDRFNLSHPAGRVRLQALPLATLGSDLRSAALDGTAPHLALLPNTWIGSLAPILLALDDQIAPADRAALLPAALGGAQIRGGAGETKLYGLPISFDTLAMFYNRANVLQAPETTDDLFRLARGFSSPSDSPPRWGLALDLSMDNTLCYLYAFGGRVFDDSGAPALGESGRAGAEQWLVWMARLNTDSQLFTHPDSGLEVDRALKNSRAVISFGWAHQLGEYRKLWGDQMGLAPLPNLSETNRAPATYVQSEVLVVNGRLSEPERRAALDFLRYMVGAEAQAGLLASGLQPARQDVPLDGDDPQTAAARVFRTQAQRGQPMPNGPERDTVREQLRLMQQRVLVDGLSPRDAVTEADRRLREALKQP